MTLLDMYYYVFYNIFKVFRFIEPSSEDIRWLKVKAASILGVFEALTMVSTVLYKIVIFKEHGEFGFFSFGMLMPLIITCLLNWLLFVRNDNWMAYVEKFDRWPKAKNQRGSWVVLVVLVLLIANIVVSVRLSPYYRP